MCCCLIPCSFRGSLCRVLFPWGLCLGVSAHGVSVQGVYVQKEVFVPHRAARDKDPQCSEKWAVPFLLKCFLVFIYFSKRTKRYKGNFWGKIISGKTRVYISNLKYILERFTKTLPTNKHLSSHHTLQEVQ